MTGRWQGTGEGVPFFSVLLHGTGIRLAACLQASGVLASAPINWIEVCGGSWKPDALVLEMAKSSLRKSLAPQFKISAAAWRRYTFQYQGNLATNGHRIVAISAFRELPEEWRGNFDLTREWVQVIGEGSCYFSANYDSTAGVILDLKVAAAK